LKKEEAIIRKTTPKKEGKRNTGRAKVMTEGPQLKESTFRDRWGPGIETLRNNPLNICRDYERPGKKFQGGAGVAVPGDLVYATSLT